MNLEGLPAALIVVLVCFIVAAGLWYLAIRFRLRQLKIMAVAIVSGAGAGFWLPNRRALFRLVRSAGLCDDNPGPGAPRGLSDPRVSISGAQSSLLAPDRTDAALRYWTEARELDDAAFHRANAQWRHFGREASNARAGRGHTLGAIGSGFPTG